MKVYNDNIKPEFVSFDKVSIGDTFCVKHNASGIESVYIKTGHDNVHYNCINLMNGRVSGFLDSEPVRLIDCELHWKFRDCKDKEDKGEE